MYNTNTKNSRGLERIYIYIYTTYTIGQRVILPTSLSLPLSPCRITSTRVMRWRFGCFGCSGRVMVGYWLRSLRVARIRPGIQNGYGYTNLTRSFNHGYLNNHHAHY